MRVLVVGGQGQLGADPSRCHRPLGRLTEALAPSHAELDLADPAALAAALDAVTGPTGWP